MPGNFKFYLCKEKVKDGIVFAKTKKMRDTINNEATTESLYGLHIEDKVRMTRDETKEMIITLLEHHMTNLSSKSFIWVVSGFFRTTL